MKTANSKIFRTAVLSLWMVVTGCLAMRTKPIMPETTVKFCVIADDPSQFSLQSVGPDTATYKLTKNGDAEITFPEVEGEVTNVLGIRYIDNEPRRYELLRLKFGQDILRRFTMEEIEDLAVGLDGCRIIDVNQ